jgi:hypothetical protein
VAASHSVHEVHACHIWTNVVDTTSHRPKLPRRQLCCTQGVHRGIIPHVAASHSVHEVHIHEVHASHIWTNVVDTTSHRPKLLQRQLGCTQGVHRGIIPQVAAHEVHIHEVHAGHIWTNVVDTTSHRPKLPRRQLCCTKGVHRGIVTSHTWLNMRYIRP